MADENGQSALAEARAAISASGAFVQEAASTYEQQKIAQDRSRIVRVVIYVWAAAIAAQVLFVFLSFLATICVFDALCAPPAGDWEKSSKQILDAITQLILPIVTLVIGYYFGTQKSEDNG